MIVKQLLSAKENADIITIAPDATVAEAARLLARHRIGAVVVSRDGRKLDGILSERDIVRAMARADGGIRDEPINGLMTANVQTCRLGDDIMTLLERMTEGRFRHLPVVDDDGVMLGVVSIGDAVSARLSELHAEKDALTGMIMGA